MAYAKDDEEIRDLFLKEIIFYFKLFINLCLEWSKSNCVDQDYVTDSERDNNERDNIVTLTNCLYFRIILIKKLRIKSVCVHNVHTPCLYRTKLGFLTLYI